MSEPFVGEVRMFAGNFAPRGWAFCDGQLLAVSQNDALFSLLGTTYGGNGQTTFGLPDLRGRLPVHAGNGPGLSPRRLGAKAGTEQVTLTINQLPSHNHPLSGTNTNATDNSPADTMTLAKGVGFDPYVDQPPSITMANNNINAVGGSQSHNNMMPFLCVNFIISLFGIYPSRN